MIAYFNIKDGSINGMSKYPFEQVEGYIVIEKEIPEQKFRMGTDIFVYENGTIKEVPPPQYDEQGNKL